MRIIATRLAGRCLGKNGVSLKSTVGRPAWPEQGCLGAVLESSFLGSAQGRPVDWDLSTAYIPWVSRDGSEAMMDHTGRTWPVPAANLDQPWRAGNSGQETSGESWFMGC